MSDKRPTLHEDIPAAATATHSSETSENDQSYVKVKLTQCTISRDCV